VKWNCESEEVRAEEWERKGEDKVNRKRKVRGVCVCVCVCVCVGNERAVKGIVETY
jgi:hypothetical protein